MRKTILLAAGLLFALPAFAAEITVPGPSITYEVPTIDELNAVDAARIADFDTLRDIMDGMSEDHRSAIFGILAAGAQRDAAIAELRTALSVVEAELAEHDHGGVVDPPPPPPPPPPPDGSPFEALAYNTWQEFGPKISSLWSSIDPQLDDLTRGTEGLSASVKQWCAKAYDKQTKIFRIPACGGHRANGYNRTTELDVYNLALSWGSPDSRLVGPNMPASACPYPSQDTVLGDLAGPAATHAYDAAATLPNGDTILWSVVPYDCKGPGNREPSRIWKLRADGVWSASSLGVKPAVTGGVASEPLPDGKVLMVGRYFAGIFDPETMDWAPYRRGSDEIAKTSSYAEIDSFGNLTAAGEDESGALVFYHGGFHKNLYRIKVRKDEDGVWNLGGPAEVPGVKAAGYTGGVTYLPDHDALMYWWGTQRVRYIVNISSDSPQVRMSTHAEVRETGEDFHIHEGGLQWDDDAKVVYAFGLKGGEGLWVFRPPVDLISNTEVPEPPREDLQGLIDAAQPGDTINITGRFNGARISKSLTINCGPNTSVGGPLTNGQGNLLVEATPFAIAGSCEFVGDRLRRPQGTAAIFMAVAGNYSVDGALFKWNANGILTSSRGWIGDINLTVRNSVFDDNGYPGNTPGHQIYYGNGGGTTDGEQSRLLPDDPMRWATTHMHGGTLLIEDSTFTGQTNGGHGVKSGAQTTIIRRSNIEQGLAGLSYRPVDNYAGGALVLEDVSLHLRFDPTETGLASEQTELIAFAPEVWGPNYRGHMPDTDSVSMTRVTGVCEGHAAYVNFKVVKAWRDVVPVWNGATAEDPDGDSSFTGCGKLYVRSE